MFSNGAEKGSIDDEANNDLEHPFYNIRCPWF